MNQAPNMDLEHVNRHLDTKTKRLLDARTPLILAAIDLGEVVCSAAFEPTKERLQTVEEVLARVDSTLAELRQAWMTAPLVMP